MSRRPRAIAPAGIVLSQPTRHTSPSNRCPRATSSIESAMTSRLMRLAFMPSVPIDTPSLTATVLNSIGVPPAARMPSFTNVARRRWLRLHGIVSIHVVATPTIGWARSSSVKPTALSIARAAARSGPSVSAWLCRLPGSDGREYGSRGSAGIGAPERGTGGGGPVNPGPPAPAAPPPAAPPRPPPPPPPAGAPPPPVVAGGARGGGRPRGGGPGARAPGAGPPGPRPRGAGGGAPPGEGGGAGGARPPPLSHDRRSR